MAEYANETVLVSTEWVAEHLNDPQVRLVEVDVDTAAYQQGHIPGSVGWNWQTQLQDQVRRDILSKEGFEKIMSQSGIDPRTTVVVYGDNSNWFAAYALWQLKIYGHQDIRLMNGGRKKWLEENRQLRTEVSNYPATNYQAQNPDESIRAKKELVTESLDKLDKFALVDVRSPDEFTGKILAPPGLNETAQRAGHIPGAQNIPWGQATREDGTFKSVDELAQLYGSKGVTREKETITYCRIGERSSHTWFVLKYLLGYPNVSNYDGSWTEWGNLVGAPVVCKTKTTLAAV